MNKNISVSLLSVSNIQEFMELFNSILKKDILNKYNYSIHFDIMDNKFVDNIGISLENIKIAKKYGFYTDVHLMVCSPFEDGYIDKAIEYGADSITIHYEIENFEKCLNKLNDIKNDLIKKSGRNLRIGVSVKPDTNVKELMPYVDKFDMLLIMSVNPGFGGQKFIENTYKKIDEASNIFSQKIIQIDGGVNFEVLTKAIQKRVDSFVIGSYISNSKDIYDCMVSLNILYEFLLLPKKANIEFDKTILQIVDGGYGEGDNYIGIGIPDIRKFVSKYYKKISINTLSPFINSTYHDLRRFAVISMSCMSNFAYDKKDIKKLEQVLQFMNDNISCINNWDLTDICAPNVLGKYLMLLSLKERKEIIKKYIKSDELWIKRIGIVSLLIPAKFDEYGFCIEIINKVMYDKRDLIQKAVGWVLRELYKKEPDNIKEFLKSNNWNKRLPPFVLSYATELMSKEDKALIKNGGQN